MLKFLVKKQPGAATDELRALAVRMQAEKDARAAAAAAEATVVATARDVLNLPVRGPGRPSFAQLKWRSEYELVLAEALRLYREDNSRDIKAVIEKLKPGTLAKYEERCREAEEIRRAEVEEEAGKPTDDTEALTDFLLNGVYELRATSPIGSTVLSRRCNGVTATIAASLHVQRAATPAVTLRGWTTVLLATPCSGATSPPPWRRFTTTPRTSGTTMASTCASGAGKR
jgi:hypothetical protein